MAREVNDPASHLLRLFLGALLLGRSTDERSDVLLHRGHRLGEGVLRCLHEQYTTRSIPCRKGMSFRCRRDPEAESNHHGWFWLFGFAFSRTHGLEINSAQTHRTSNESYHNEVDC